MIDMTNPNATFVTGFLLGGTLVFVVIYRQLIWEFLRSFLPKKRKGNGGGGELDEFKEDTQDPDESECTVLGNEKLELLRHLHGDSKRLYDELLRTYESSADKSIKLAQVNGVVLTILIATAGVIGLDTWINPLTIFGTFLFVVSGMIAVFAYRTIKMGIGVHIEDLVYILEKDHTELDYHQWMVEDLYPEMIPDTMDIVDQKGAWVDRSILAFGWGLIILFTGIVLSPVL